MRFKLIHLCIWLFILLLLVPTTTGSAASSANFTRSDQPARLYGAHEIILRGNGLVANPFDTQATITFIPPSGADNAVTVDMFFDGENVWRGRAYITEVGLWSWITQSPDDRLLHNQSGSFTAADSDLPGMLRQHPRNPRQWATERGDWFLNLSDTAYRLMEYTQEEWREYIHDAAAMGITSFRSGALGGWEWLPSEQGEFGASNYPWSGDDLTRYDLDKFRTTDIRLQWLLDTYPDVYVQLILFGQIDWNTQDAAEAWFAVPQEARENTMRYMLARWAAYPNVFWLTVNDLACGEGFELNDAYTREIGRFFAARDPWGHLLSTSPSRNEPFCFAGEEDADWVSYIHLQGGHMLDALPVDEYAHVPLHVFLAEDYYEQEHPERHPRHPDFFQRWLFWSWLMAGGSANYGGRYWVLHPYSQTADRPITFRGIDYGRLRGLDSVPYIKRYFEERAIDLSQFERANGMVASASGANDIRRPQAAQRGALDELLVYHPNAANSRRFAEVNRETTAAIAVNLSDSFHTYTVEWYRAEDGVAQMGPPVDGGQDVVLTAPWTGYDVVLRLIKGERLPPTPTPPPTPTEPPEETPEATDEP
jgi:hypothetical protein